MIYVFQIYLSNLRFDQLNVFYGNLKISVNERQWLAFITWSEVN